LISIPWEALASNIHSKSLGFAISKKCVQVSKERRSSKQLAESTVHHFDIHGLRAAKTGAFMVITCTVQADKDRTRAATGSAFFYRRTYFPIFGSITETSFFEC
jgi:hypothetical protein